MYSTVVHSCLQQKLQCSPTSDGAAAAVVASEEFVKAHGLQDKGEFIVGGIGEYVRESVL